MTMNLQQPSEGHGESSSMLDGGESDNFDGDLSNSNSAISSLLEYDQINNPKKRVCSSGGSADELTAIAENQIEAKTATDYKKYDSINKTGGETITGENSNGTTKSGVPEIILRPNKHDVLLGRGSGINQWIGNGIFRTFVREMYLSYVNSPRRNKFVIVRTLLTKMRALQPSGRFLKQEHGMWYEVHDDVAMAKIGQCLRDMSREKPKNKEAMKSPLLLNRSTNQVVHGTVSSSNFVLSNTMIQSKRSNMLLEKGLPIFDIRADYLFAWSREVLKQMIHSDTISNENIVNLIVQQFLRRLPTVKDKFDCYKITEDFLNLFDHVPMIPIVSKTEILDQCMKRVTDSNTDHLNKRTSIYQRNYVNMIAKDGKFLFEIDESSIIRNNNNSDWIPIGIMATSKEIPLHAMNSAQLGFFVRNRFFHFVDRCPLSNCYTHFILEESARSVDCKVIRCPCGRICIAFQDNGMSKLDDDDDDLGNFILISYKGSRHNQRVGGGYPNAPYGQSQPPTIMNQNVQQTNCKQQNAMVTRNMAQQQHYQLLENQRMNYEQQANMAKVTATQTKAQQHSQRQLQPQKANPISILETNAIMEASTQVDNADRQSQSSNHNIDPVNPKRNIARTDNEYVIDLEESQFKNEDANRIELISYDQPSQSPSKTVDTVNPKGDTIRFSNEILLDQEDPQFKSKDTNRNILISNNRPLQSPSNIGDHLVKEKCDTNRSDNDNLIDVEEPQFENQDKNNIEQVSNSRASQPPIGLEESQSKNKENSKIKFILNKSKATASSEINNGSKTLSNHQSKCYEDEVSIHLRPCQKRKEAVMEISQPSKRKYHKLVPVREEELQIPFPLKSKEKSRQQTLVPDQLLITAMDGLAVMRSSKTNATKYTNTFSSKSEQKNQGCDETDISEDNQELIHPSQATQPVKKINPAIHQNKTEKLNSNENSQEDIICLDSASTFEFEETTESTNVRVSFTNMLRGVNNDNDTFYDEHKQIFLDPAATSLSKADLLNTVDETGSGKLQLTIAHAKNKKQKENIQGDATLNGLVSLPDESFTTEPKAAPKEIDESEENQNYVDPNEELQSISTVDPISRRDVTGSSMLQLRATQDETEKSTSETKHQANLTFNGHKLFDKRDLTYTAVSPETNECTDPTAMLSNRSKVAAFNVDSQRVSPSPQRKRKTSTPNEYNSKDHKRDLLGATPEIEERRNLLRRIEALRERKTIRRELKRLRLSPQLISEASDSRRFSTDELVSSNEKLQRYITNELQRQVLDLENDLEDDAE